MISKILTKITQLSFYPRIALDWIIYASIQKGNDWSLLEKFKQQDCLVVGNGPSLNETPLEQIKMLSIGMNKINLLFDRTSWRPDLIVCVNGLVIKQNRDFFNTTKIPLILPVKALYLGIKRRSNIIFTRISDSKEFVNDISKPVGIGHTVTFTCLQVAAHAKVKSVNIVGVDHNFKYTGDKGIKLHEGADLNHFDPNYFKDSLWGLPNLDGSEKAYSKAKSYFDKQSIPVIDYTINGKLTVFQKGNIEDIIDRGE